jgi:hypothetical protein
MRKSLCFRVVLLSFISFLFNSVKAQSDRFAYAVTAINKGGTEWVALRKLDIRSGEFSSVLLDFKEKSLYNFSNYKLAPPPAAANSSTAGQANLLPQAVLGNSVAALAFDKKANRLYFSPMNLDQLQYIDLNTMQVVNLDQYFSKAGNYDFKTAGPVSRMVIAPDDYGYTITNDGNHLIRFNTKGVQKLTDLGALVDNPLNKENSIVQNPCANSGGDIVADDAGSLYLIVSTNKVFKVDIATKETTYLKTISGLPQKFTTSGAAVTEDGRIIISSSLYSDAVFVVDPETWEALPTPASPEIYGSADLANSNALQTKRTGNIIFNEPEKSNKIKVFPNPLLYDEVNVQFNSLPPGNYTIQMTNVLGRKSIEKKVLITESTQTELLRVPGFTAQGFYYIRIIDESNKVVGIQKLVVERW